MPSHPGASGTKATACLNPSCGREARKRCSGCKAVRFCGEECQTLMWGSHKALCKSLAKEPAATVLLLDGLGMLGPKNFYTKAVKKALACAGTTVATVDVTKKPGLFRQVGSALSELRRFTSCIVLGVGSCSYDDAGKEFEECAYFRERVVSWVDRGGRFIVQGERGAWPTWFDKPWTFSEYRRTTHDCHAKSVEDVHWCKWYPEAKGSITSTINVKAVMMEDVAEEDMLFCTTASSVSYSNVFFMAGLSIEEGLAAVAHGKFGEGSLSFFGDVNAEKDTCTIMAVIAHGPQ